MNKTITADNVEDTLCSLSVSQASRLKEILWEVDLIYQFKQNPREMRRHLKKEIKVRRGKIKRVLAFIVKQTDAQLVDFFSVLYEEGYYTKVDILNNIGETA